MLFGKLGIGHGQELGFGGCFRRGRFRKPKIVAAAPGEAFPPDGADEPRTRMAEERSAAKRTLMGSDVKVSKVAQALAAVGDGESSESVDIFALHSHSETNFTNFTKWC